MARIVEGPQKEGESLFKSTSAFNNFLNRSEEAQEVISRRPDFIEKWALFILLSVLLFLLGATWFIQYPDVVESRAVLSSYNRPKEIIPLQTGRLSMLFVQNGDSVKQGEVICWIESTSNPEDIMKLSAQLDSSTYLLEHGEFDIISRLFVEQFDDLGGIQTSYQTFITALQQFDDYVVNGFYARRREMILKDINSISQVNATLLKEQRLKEEDNKLSQDAYEMNEKLYNEKVISLDEYRQQRSILLNKKMAIPQIKSSILANESSRRSKVTELERLNHSALQQRVTFEQALRTLKSNIDRWKHQYIIRAPINGVFFFDHPIQQSQFVKEGKLLGYVSPSISQFYAQAYLPQKNLGKVDTGMTVQLRFDAYPYEEAGFVSGKVDYISHIVSDSGYLAIIRLTNGLRTNLNRSIQYKNGLTADALIITRKMRLLKRLYYMMVKVTSVGKDS